MPWSPRVNTHLCRPHSESWPKCLVSTEGWAPGVALEGSASHMDSHRQRPLEAALCLWAPRL